MALTRRGLLGAGGALALVPAGGRRAETVPYAWRRAGWSGGVDLRVTEALGPALRAVGATAGPAARTDEEVVRIDMTRPDLIGLSAPGALPGWSLRVHRPPGEPDDWAELVSTALLVTVAPVACWMGQSVFDLSVLAGPVWASALGVPSLLAPGGDGPWFAPLRRRVVRPQDAALGLVLLRQDLMKGPFVDAMWALDVAMHPDVPRLLSVCGEWWGPEELLVVLLRPRGDDGLRAPGA